MSGFISQGWQECRKEIKGREPHASAFDTRAFRVTTPIMKHGNFFEVVQDACPEEFQRILDIWRKKEDHPIFNKHPAYWAKEKYDVELGRSTAYYIMQACYLLNCFPDLKDKKIVEVGAAYGGLARVLLEVEPKIKRYSIIDIDMMLAAAKEILGKKAKYYDTTETPYKGLGKQDIFICNVCLSETTPEFLNYLKAKVWPLCENFFILDNDDYEGWPCDDIWGYFKKNNLRRDIIDVPIKGIVAYVAKPKGD